MMPKACIFLYVKCVSPDMTALKEASRGGIVADEQRFGKQREKRRLDGTNMVLEMNRQSALGFLTWEKT